jgi:hypothetical protein
MQLASFRFGGRAMELSGKYFFGFLIVPEALIEFRFDRCEKVFIINIKLSRFVLDEYMTHRHSYI